MMLASQVSALQLPRHVQTALQFTGPRDSALELTRGREPGIERRCLEYLVADELEAQQLEIGNAQPRDGITPVEDQRAQILRALSARLCNSLAAFGFVSFIDEHNGLLLVEARTHFAKAVPACSGKRRNNNVMEKRAVPGH